MSDEDISLDSVYSDDMNIDDFNMDLNDLISDSPSPSSKPPSPIKKLRTHTTKPASYMNLESKPKLTPIINNSHSSSITNEIFKVTSNLGKLHRSERSNHKTGFRIDENDFAPLRKLTNDKVAKLVHDLGMNNDPNGHIFDYELDEKLRARFYKGRFTKDDRENETKHQQISNYLQEDKENYPYPDPLKISKSDRKITKSKAKRNLNTKIPVLKPLTNLTNLENDYNSFSFINNANKINKSPKRICLPKHRSSKPTRPAIKYDQEKKSIFVVDSSTGRIDDATMFGTELNASAGNDFPLPLGVNEVVHIPTNDDKKELKMAIIKMFQSKSFSDVINGNLGSNNGFYNQRQFQVYEQGKERVDVLNEVDKTKAKVHWPDDLEW